MYRYRCPLIHVIYHNKLFIISCTWRSHKKMCQRWPCLLCNQTKTLNMKSKVGLINCLLAKLHLKCSLPNFLHNLLLVGLTCPERPENQSQKSNMENLFKPPHDKTSSVAVRPAKTQISLGGCPVWSAASLCAWRKVWSLATHWTHSEDSDQPGRMPRLIWVFVVRIATLLALSWGGSFYCCNESIIRLSPVTRKPAFSSLQPGKIQSGLLSYTN